MTLATRAHVRKVSAHEILRLRLQEVLEDVRDEQRVEPAGLRVLRRGELVGGEHGEARAARDLDGDRIGVDADSVAVEVREVAAEAAPHVEHEPRLEPADVATVRALHVERAGEPPALELLEPAGVRVAGVGGHVDQRTRFPGMSV